MCLSDVSMEGGFPNSMPMDCGFHDVMLQCANISTVKILLAQGVSLGCLIL